MSLHLLDTDHMSILRRGGASAVCLEMRLSAISDEEIVTCVVVFEEQMRGWMAEIARMQTGTQLIVPYSSLATTLSIYCAMTVPPFDERAAAHFDELKRRHIRVGTQDLKIGAIALANDATLITRNTQDFGRIPDLRFEDWSD
ncbi:MAG TPA: type II toxin-antitoxin system VapC family toxin [Armatimonadota bacterium]|nr:type II toxin-antitoxin system VapC family toxin [Armatimonadota bacterium]